LVVIAEKIGLRLLVSIKCLIAKKRERNKMRLDEKTRDIIKSEVASQLGTEAIVRLFGSRVDDTQRGGDIDLLIEPGRPLAHRIQVECRLAALLYIKLGGRKVDVIIKDSLSPLRPIHEQALRNGIVL
jgi:predicted nucleotidyltransferase